MNNKTPFLVLSDQFDQVLAERNNLLTENANLREAVEHYFHCRECAEGAVFDCAEGYEYAVKLGLYVPNTEAVERLR